MLVFFGGECKYLGSLGRFIQSRYHTLRGKTPLKFILPETNSIFAPEKWMVGRRSRFLLRFGLFSGANLLLVLGSGTAASPENQ